MLSKYDIGSRIKQIHDALERDANNLFRAKNLTLSQWRLLLVLSEASDGSHPLKTLEKLMHVSQATTAGIVQRLEQKGFIEGFGDIDDKRVKNVRITEKGRTVCDEASEQMDCAEQRLAGGLTEIEKQLFRELLRKVSENVK
jgi:DNA-binding MarR family transcriptional regulator